MTQDTRDTQLIPQQQEALAVSVVDTVLPPEDTTKRRIAAVVAIVIAVVSLVFLGAVLSNPETYAHVLASLDEKKSTVMNLVAGSTTTSAAITLLPGDVGTPIAEKLLDLGGNFAIVIGAIYLEKYLLTILGFVAFRVLVPIACVLFALSMACTNRLWLGRLMRRVGGRLALFGVLIFLVIPVSVWATDAIDTTYEASMAATLAQAEQTANQAEAQAQSMQDSDEANSEQNSGILSFIQGIPETIATTAQGVSKDAQDTLNRFIETFAVMIVTSCVIPIVVLLLFILLAKTILGIRFDFDAMRLLNARTFIKRR